MAANDYYGGPPPVYPPPQHQQHQQGYGGYSPQPQGYYNAPAPPASYTGPDGKPHPFAHYLQQPAPLPPQQQGGYLQPYSQGQVSPYGQSTSRPSSPPQFGPDGQTQDRGLGSTLVGGIAGSALAHKMGGGALGTIAGAVGGAILANVASHKIKDKKKKKKKGKKHGRRRKGGSSSSSESESDSDSSRSSGGKKPHGKRYALGYSTGGGSVFGPVARRGSRSRRHYSSESD